MTRPRWSTCEETPFGAWVRQHPDLESHTSGLTVTDCDWFFHKYITPRDGIGTRELHLMLCLEVKCFNAIPTPSQCETLSEFHQCLAGHVARKVNRPGRGPTTLIHYGMYIVSLPGTSPEDAPTCRWGQFDAHGDLYWTVIPSTDVGRILGFAIRPDTFRAEDFRRHHLTRTLMTSETTALGFDVETIIIKRS